MAEETPDETVDTADEVVDTAADAPDEVAASADADDAASAVEDTADADGVDTKAKGPTAERTVTRRAVTSKRVTPKGASQGVSPKKGANATKGNPVDRSQYTQPTRPVVYDKGPSPWWVPAIMFALLIIGALVIMGNYMGVFGDAANIRLVIGLVFILGGIITATQYR